MYPQRQKTAATALALVIFALTGFSPSVNAQEGSTRLEIRTSAYASPGPGGQLPFWFHSNVHGKVDPAGSNIINELRFSRTLLEYSSVTVSAGADAAYRITDSDSHAWFSELYVRIRGYGLQLEAGRFVQPGGLYEAGDISAGSMTVGSNSVPVPSVSLSTPGFVNVPFTGGWLRYKGMFSHGRLEKDRHVRSPYLHRKHLYLQVNTGRLSAAGGIVHNVTWAGEDPQYGPLPASFGDFLRVVTGRGADRTSNVPDGEVSNVIGNSVAAYEFGLNWDQGAWDLGLSRLFYLEDKVSTRFRSPWDGIWRATLSLKNRERSPLPDAVTYEHFNTKQQDAREGETIGRASYYNHSIYRSGWTYGGRVLGFPLARYDSEQERIVSNIMVGHHLGFKGILLENFSYRVLFTWARHYGTRKDLIRNGETVPMDELRTDQFSWLLDTGYRFPGTPALRLDINIGSDFGRFYDTGTAFMLGIGYDFGRR